LLISAWGSLHLAVPIMRREEVFLSSRGRQILQTITLLYEYTVPSPKRS